MIPVILITGFLGSGKTTLLKQMARTHRNRRFVYLVNDFASVDVDGELVREADEHVVALSGGSIFCHCLVTEFIGTLRGIAEGRIGGDSPPDTVIIEASGMADPRVIGRLLKETGLDARFALRRIIAVADPGTLPKLLHTLPNIRAQIECADTVLISKADGYPQDVLDATRVLLREIQPDARCGFTRHGVADLDLLDAAPRPDTDGACAPCKDPQYHRFTLTEAVPDLDGFRARVETTQQGLYRAKGFVEQDGQVYAVDWSSSGLHSEPWCGVPTALRVVCICAGEDGHETEAIWRQ